MPINDDTSSSALLLRSARCISGNTGNESIAPVRQASDQNHRNNTSAFPFLKLPAELRVQVYRYLLHARYDIFVYSSEEMSLIFWDHHNVNYFSEDKTTNRNKYRVMAIGLHPAILSVNRQTYQEASRVLYSENRFSFSSNDYLSCIHATAAVIPFFKHLSEGSRRLIRKIQYVYMDAKSLGLSHQFKAEQNRLLAKTCDYLDQNLQPQHVTLRYFFKYTFAPYARADFRNTMADFRLYNANVHKHDWTQRLRPFAKKLEALALIGEKKDRTEMIHAAQRYLDDEEAEASKTTCQFQIT